MAGRGSVPEKATHPAVNRPTIRVPATVAWQMGMTSCSSASKTLARRQNMKANPVAVTSTGGRRSRGMDVAYL